MQNVDRIPLPDGSVALIDTADAALVAGFNWRRIGNGYVQAQRGKLYIYLHRLVAGAGPGELVDHANRDALDNRASNLRIATASQNGANRIGDRRRLGTSSRFKGVSLDRRRNRWKAFIHVDGRSRQIGRFDTEEAAALAYNEAALATWGEFARLNHFEEGSG